MTTFRWEGKHIPNIRAWARKRGEKMVCYSRERIIASSNCEHLITEIQDGLMPESFWNTLKQDFGWSFTEISREDA